MYTAFKVEFTVEKEGRQMETKTKSQIYPLVMTAVMAAVISAIAPFALPIGPIPITLGTLVMYLAGYVLGGKRAGAAVLVYVLLGAVGVPVFNGFTGGLGVVAGPTGGYIIGYIPMALLAGLTVERFPSNRVFQFGGMIFATAVLYALGTAWFCVQAGKSLLPPCLCACSPLSRGIWEKWLWLCFWVPSFGSALFRLGFSRPGDHFKVFQEPPKAALVFFWKKFYLN